MRSLLRFTFALPDPQPEVQGELVRQALAMARHADDHGVDLVVLDEHHATDFGWGSNPLLTGGMILSQTTRLRVAAVAALGPLWNPIRFAEDLAMVDQVSGGRMSVTLGLGYRPEEYAALGLDFGRRGELMDEALTLMLAAWSGEEFERGGRTVRITPRPLSRPHPFVMVGGAVRATARRAVRFGLPLQIPDHLPELRQYYLDLCREAGVRPIVDMVPEHRPGMTFLHPDPDRAWAELGHHVAWEAIEYGRWQSENMRSVMHGGAVTTPEEVRAAGRYRVITPEQCRAEMAQGQAVTVHPLMGGMPIEAAWQCLHLLTDEVLPALAS